MQAAQVEGISTASISGGLRRLISSTEIGLVGAIRTLEQIADHPRLDFIFRPFDVAVQINDVDIHIHDGVDFTGPIRVYLESFFQSLVVDIEDDMPLVLIMRSRICWV